MTKLKLQPIGAIHSPYQEKFSVPRQPNLVPEGTGELHLLHPYADPNSIKGLEQFSHLWLLFIFDRVEKQKWQASVRPPRLGGNKKIGVFSTRSPFRPNNIGLSAVELRGIVIKKKQIILELGCLDLLDGTPIIDIKPYLPYCDSYPDAKAGYAQFAPNELLEVDFTEQVENKISELNKKNPNLKLLITQVLSQDPRPAYKKEQSDNKIYGTKLYRFNIQWYVDKNKIIVHNIDHA